MILVTGGAGYIGSHTAVVLLEQGYEIVVVDNLSNSHPKAIERVKQITGKDFPFYEVDLRDASKLAAICEKHQPTAAIHFAGLKAVGESVKMPLAYYQNNIDSTLNLLKTMIDHEIKQVIFSSSATVYSATNTMPLTESAARGCTNPYGWTKFVCEQIIKDTVSANAGFSAVLLRYFNPVGAHESGLIGENPLGIPNNLVPFIAQTAAGKHKELAVYGDDYDTKDGTGVRDYIHVTDLAVGHVAAINFCASNDGTHVFNLGTGQGTSVLEMVHAFENANGVKVPVCIAPRRAGDLATCYADPGKAKEVLRWNAKKSIDEMCVDVWRWQSMNPNGYE